MTPRERVQTVLSGSIPDRVPIIIGVSNATGIKMGAYRQIKDLAGVDEDDRHLYDWPELGTALPGEAGLTRLRSDVRGIHDRFPREVYDHNQSRPEHSPDMDDPYRYEHMRGESMALRACTDTPRAEYAIMATPWLLFPLERAFAMQGMDTFLLNMAMHPQFAEALLRKHLELCKTLMGHVLDQLGDNVDIVKIGDDLGTQESLMMSPSMYREMLAPIHAEFVAFIKERTTANVFFYTDGDVFDLIPDFIEMGIDILNPIQTSAGRMSDLERLKGEYGGAITFCGAIDTHEVLPHGSTDEVRAEVKRVIDVLGAGGGYMVASVHTIMNDVPPENVLAMVDGVEEFGRYE